MLVARSLFYYVPGLRVKKQEVMTKAEKLVSSGTVYKWRIGTEVCSQCVNVSSVSFSQESPGQGQSWDQSLNPIDRPKLYGGVPKRKGSGPAMGIEGASD